jgi:hypothetical protein
MHREACIQSDDVTVSNSGKSSLLQDAFAKEEVTRSDLLREIQTAQQSLASQLTELRQADVSHLHDDMISQGGAKLLQLNALRDQLVGGANGVPLAALRANIGSAVADTRAYTSSVSAATLSVQNGSTAQVLSMGDYQRATSDIDRRVAQSYVQEGQHLAYAHDIASRYGIDISGYDQERTALESERDTAKRKGDKIGERKADALIAQNTYNTMTGELDGITDPVARKKHLDAMHDQQRIVDERRAALAAQIELEARRTAALRNLSPDETAAYVAQSKSEQLADFDSRRDSLKGSGQSEAARTELKTAVMEGASRQAPGTAPVPVLHPVAAALSPDARTASHAAAAKINAAHDTTAGSLEDSGFAPATTSAIVFAANPDAHKKVEVPQVPAQGNSNAVSAPPH